MNITKDQILDAIKDSTSIEANFVKNKVRRMNNMALPAFIEKSEYQEEWNDRRKKK